MQYIQLQAQVAEELDLPLEGGFNLFIDTSDNTIKVKDSEGNLTGGGNASVEVEYDELYSLVQSASLTTGQFYTITDFQTFYDQPDYTANRAPITGSFKSGSIEPLVVLAISSASLAPNAYSTRYPKHTIKYDVYFTASEATNNPAKGRIYERIDEVGNRTDYDWRAVQFKRYDSFYCESSYPGTVSVIASESSSLHLTTGSIVGVGTDFDNDFSAGDVIGVKYVNYDRIGGFDFYEIVSVSGSTFMEITGSYYHEVNNLYYSRAQSQSGLSPFQTNTVSVYTSSYEYYTFNPEGDGTPAENDWYNNYLGNNENWQNDADGVAFILSNNVFLGGAYRDNYFDSNVVGNTFDEDIYGNKCGRYFQYNIIEDDFDNNTIRNGFAYNYIRSDFQENSIGDDFEYNMLSDDDSVDFNNNIINGDSFSHNWTIGYDDFTDNIINAEFNNNVFYNSFENNVVSDGVYDNLFDADIRRNQFKDDFYANKIYGNFYNNVLNRFYENTILDTFERNQFNGTAFNNTISGSFFDNTLGENFAYNTFSGIAAYNQIGYGFDSNIVGDSFGVGYGSPRANKIGNAVYDNTIGEYFYSNTISDNFYENTIGDYFQQNVVLANNLNNTNFNEYYGNITSIENPSPNVGGEDGVYTLIPTTTNGHGIDATFDVTIASGIASVEIVNVGTLYENGDVLTLTGSLIGGGSNLELTVDGITDTPMVYGNYDTTIQKASNGDVVLSVLMPGEGYFNYITQNITQALPD